MNAEIEKLVKQYQGIAPKTQPTIDDLKSKNDELYRQSALKIVDYMDDIATSLDGVQVSCSHEGFAFQFNGDVRPWKICFRGETVTRDNAPSDTYMIHTLVLHWQDYKTHLLQAIQEQLQKLIAQTEQSQHYWIDRETKNNEYLNNFTI